MIEAPGELRSISLFKYEPCGLTNKSSSRFERWLKYLQTTWSRKRSTKSTGDVSINPEFSETTSLASTNLADDGSHDSDSEKSTHRRRPLFAESAGSET
jgi:hypothetical protein